ncbi:MAG: ankyrin repeat domain-containing protein [Burkholderiales bacterium]|nr:ankyrin repeat domain-containing protein [Burkholderiales bacterium]
MSQLWITRFLVLACTITPFTLFAQQSSHQASTQEITQAASMRQHDAFFYAVRFNDLKKVQAMVEQGFDLNAREASRGESALMIAIREQSYDVFDYLIHHPKIHLDERANNGDTALMLAAYLEKVDWLSELIFAGAQVNQAGWTALHYAAAAGDLQIVAVLLEHRADLNALSPNHTTPLMMAARKGNVSVAELLLKEGASLDAKNMQGMTALDFAVESEKKEMQGFLQAWSRR